MTVNEPLWQSGILGVKFSIDWQQFNSLGVQDLNKSDWLFE